jgi:hypothetical protein
MKKSTLQVEEFQLGGASLMGKEVEMEMSREKCTILWLWSRRADLLTFVRLLKEAWRDPAVTNHGLHLDKHYEGMVPIMFSIC